MSFVTSREALHVIVYLETEGLDSHKVKEEFVSGNPTVPCVHAGEKVGTARDFMLDGYELSAEITIQAKYAEYTKAISLSRSWPPRVSVTPQLFVAIQKQD